MTRSITDRRSLRAAVTACVLAATLLPGRMQAQKGDASVLAALTEATQALYLEDTALATRRFDEATVAIASIWGGTPEAANARRLWYGESVKPFRGEAYERMMAFYYRGLLYLRAGDTGNAQAAFRLAIQQDAYAEEDQHRSDVVAPLYLLGVALQAQGSDGAARQAFAQLRELRPDLGPLTEADLPRALLIVETGYGPRKLTDGINADRLRIFRGKAFTESYVKASVAGAAATLVWPLEDVYWQASTRGARPIDFLLRGKARFKENTQGRGSMFADLGSAIEYQASYNMMTKSWSNEKASRVDVQMKGAGETMELIGAAGQLLGAFVNPAADARHWDNLPDRIHVLPLDLPPGRHTVTLSFQTLEGTSLPDLEREVEVDIPAGGRAPAITWVSSRHRMSKYLQTAR